MGQMQKAPFWLMGEHSLSILAQEHSLEWFSRGKQNIETNNYTLFTRCETKPGQANNQVHPIICQDQF